MNALLPLLLMAIAPDVPIEARYPEADTVFHCTFDDSRDENYDRWPDQWQRQQGPQYPSYLSIKIVDEPSPGGDRCLRVDLDGRAAAAYSPPIQITPLFSYVLEGYVKTQGLKHDRACFSLTFLDRQKQRLQTFHSQEVGQTQGWKKLRLGPIAPQSEDARFAMVGLHVEPQSQQDLKGTVLFADVWLGRLPRMRLKTSDPYNFFTDPKMVEIDCTVSGLLPADPLVTFEVQDVWGKPLAQQQRSLTTSPAGTDTDVSLGSFSGKPTGVVGTATWRPPISAPGFYRAQATMKGRKTLVISQQLNLVVVEPSRNPAGGEFGWTLPSDEQPLPLPLLDRLLAQAGINWVKYPLQPDGRHDNGYIQRLFTFAERLDEQGIKLVGLLSSPQPPPNQDRHSGPLPAAKLFAADPKVWYQPLEPVISRLAGQIRWWQLGEDGDTSLAEDPHAAEEVSQVRAQLEESGQVAGLAIGWDPLHQVPPAAAAQPPWKALVLAAQPSLPPQELATYLDALQGTQLKRWVVLEPLPAGICPLEDRAADLTERMMAAKIHAAEAIFCAQPFSTQHGLLGDDGTPGELFLPWRTTALLLGGAKYLGSIELPGGSHNQVFARTNDAVMVVWNDKPTEEVIYLGEEIQQIDLWGHRLVPQQQGHRQVVQVGRLPTFLTGVSEAITRWRIDFSFAQQRIPSIFGQRHQNSFRQKNDFAQDVAGRAELVMPETWKVAPKQLNLQLPPGQSQEYPFEITLPFNALSVPQKVRVDFQLQADRPYRFSVYRQMVVGDRDLHIETATALKDNGVLEVRQRLVNESDNRVSFRCELFAPGRRRLLSQVIDLGHGDDLKTYLLPDGRQLLGETLWLRADEVDGPRTLSYRFPAEQ